MAITDKKNRSESKQAHPLDKKFQTIEEAANAKTDYLVNHVLKGYDLSKLKK